MRYLTFVPQYIYRSLKRTINGKEQLWIVVLLWGAMLWFGFYYTDILFSENSSDIEQFSALKMLGHLLFLVLGSVLLFLYYPIGFPIFLKRNISNVSAQPFSWLLAIIGITVVFIHFGMAMWNFGGLMSHFHSFIKYCKLF